MRLSLLVLLAACAPRTDFDDPANVAAWANSGSALSAFLPARLPLEIAEGVAVPADPACPSVDASGDTTTIVGDCTDTEGDAWFGEATVTATGDDHGITLDGFARGDEDAATVDGSWALTANGPDDRSFSTSWSQDGLVPVEVEYDGRVEGTYTGPTLWNGSGTVTRRGFTDAVGTADVTTVDQLRDGAICSNQSASGTTTIVQKGTTVVVTYDGATDCDDEQSAQYSVDGEDRGSVDGVTCATARPRAAWMGVLALVAVAGVRRRDAGRGLWVLARAGL